MKEINLKSKQSGVFTIEFAFVGVFLGILFMFAGDAIAKLSMKGKLDRLSYSATSLIKERTQLFDEDYLTTAADANMVFDVLSGSLDRTTASYQNGRFGMVIEEQTYAADQTPNPLVTLRRGQQNCELEQTLGDLRNSLSVVTSWGREAALYRVTLCYSTDNLVDGLLDNGFNMVSSSSVVIGR
ncbi:tight adherence pilus pseudopilin TadF [Vibrio scophthalmi]|uniref:tight adherence pilus pseudopilin TadF n=1 Tax=Vibrio scophthalmi TaxID=45658 RepID=UPI003872F069